MQTFWSSIVYHGGLHFFQTAQKGRTERKCTPSSLKSDIFPYQLEYSIAEQGAHYCSVMSPFESTPIKVMQVTRKWWHPAFYSKQRGRTSLKTFNCIFRRKFLFMKCSFSLFYVAVQCTSCKSNALPRNIWHCNANCNNEPTIIHFSLHTWLPVYLFQHGMPKVMKSFVPASSLKMPYPCYCLITPQELVPCWHEQWYEPMVFRQMCWQPPLLVAHSSLSRIQKQFMLGVTFKPELL